MNRKCPKRFAFAGGLLIIVYSFVLLFSVSHNHQSKADFRAELSADLETLVAKDHHGHWHSDQHHSSSCQLVSQTPASLISWMPVSCHPIQITEFNPVSFPATFPITKRLTRAPPFLS